MNKLYSIILYLLLANSNTVFSNEQVSIDSNIIFSDSEYEGSNPGHVITILDFIIGHDDIAYSVVRLQEFPSEKESYKLFIANNKEFKSYYLKELSDYENVTIGVMGFDNSGRLKIPVILGSKNRGSVNTTINLYEYNNGEISYTSDLLPEKKISSAVYNKGILFISDRRGGLHLYKNDGETISIKKQKIERIRDVKVQGENAFILSNKYGERKVDLIQLTLNKNDVHSLISFDLQDNQVTYDLKIDLLVKEYLIISISPHYTPTHKASAKLIKVNYKSKIIIDDFTFDNAIIDIGINMVCIEGSKSLVPMVAYAKDNGYMYDLITEFEGKKYVLNSDKEYFIWQIETKYSNGVFHIFSVYKNIIGRNAYAELSLFHISNKEFVACD